jgi:hypothetical protein
MKTVRFDSYEPVFKLVTGFIQSDNNHIN